MTHPLQEILRGADGLLLSGDSTADRFPGFSYAAYTKANKPFFCLDLGGLPASRGPVKGGKVYHSVAELPAEKGDLAVIWVKPKRAKEAVDIAHEAGCKRVWFSFGSGHRDAVGRARELGLDVVEIGRCPVYYLDGAPIGCAAHTLMVKATGAWAKPPKPTRTPNTVRFGRSR